MIDRASRVSGLHTIGDESLDGVFIQLTGFPRAEGPAHVLRIAVNALEALDLAKLEIFEEPVEELIDRGGFRLGTDQRGVAATRGRNFVALGVELFLREF